MSELIASNVYAATGSVRPQLWVYEGRGDHDSVKTSSPPAARGADTPDWGRANLCVSLQVQAREDSSVCFDIRDAGSNAHDPAGHTLLHSGCSPAIAALSFGKGFKVKLSGRNGGGPATLIGRITAAPPSPPPTPPNPPGWHCSSPWCGTFNSWLVGNSADAAKFMSLWGRTAWVIRSPQGLGCWEDKGGRRYFQNVLAGTGCDRNWFQGYHGDSKDDRPEFTAAAPALLGFDGTIWDLCTEQVAADYPYLHDGYSNQEMSRRCIATNHNILRLQRHWDMCTNLEWQLCAAKGLLPGQQGRGIAFSTAPKTLSIGEWHNPTTWPCQQGCPPSHYSVGDVYFAEIAVYNQICRGAAQLFEVGRGEEMQCDVDEVRFHDLANRLIRSSCHQGEGSYDTGSYDTECT